MKWTMAGAAQAVTTLLSRTFCSSQRWGYAYVLTIDSKTPYTYSTHPLQHSEYKDDGKHGVAHAMHGCGIVGSSKIQTDVDISAVPN